MGKIARIPLYSLVFSLAIAATPALAQNAEPAAQDEAPAAGAVPGDIIVTAQKRAERLQSVPVSIQAVESKTLANLAIATPREFGQISPTLNFQAADEARLFNFSIRGIGTESFSVGVEPSVSTIVDGVREVSRQLRSISDSSTEQSAGLQEVTQTVGNLDEITRQNAPASGVPTGLPSKMSVVLPASSGP